MKKIKFFLSLLKERDWLEEMAAQGWLLTNITGGIIYTFKQVEPCEKVFEIERFAITSHPTVAELTARARAFDITSQFGWEQITHDEDMNHYFVKDKAGDETDEFYDDEESRRERAERYRKHLCVEQPQILILETLIFSVVFFLISLLEGFAPSYSFPFFTVFATIELSLIYASMAWGQRIYTELSMSREEWELYKKHTEKKKFSKVSQLLTFLQEKDASGLTLKTQENHRYQFEPSSRRYDYYIDTKACLKQRVKEEGQRFQSDKKDLMTQGLKWYEMSIAHAARYGFTPVTVLDKNVLVYKRPHSDAPMPQDNGNASLRIVSPALAAVIFFGCCGLIGFVAGFCAAWFFG